MPNSAEDIKTRYGNPFDAAQALERAATEGMKALSEDDLFMCKWLGLYPHRHEPDFFMLRTKHPNGFVTADQLETLAAIAEKNSRSYADITTRQDFQLHWVPVSQALEILQQLKAAGITTQGACGDVLRNVVGCPVAGVDKGELFDAGPTAHALSKFFLSRPEYANLPRKYKISVSACQSGCALPEIQCLSFVGAARQVEGRTELGFDVRAGGGLSTQPFISRRLNVFATPEQAVEIAARIIDIWREDPVYREKRHHARFKFLIHDWGVEKFRAILEQRLGRALAAAPADYQDPADAFRDHIGVHAQKQAGLFYVGAPVPVGRITSAQMRKIADLSRRYSDGQSIRLTGRQNILLLNLPEAHVEKVLSHLQDAGLSINAHPVRRSVVTCTGTEFCRLAITETKARARQIVDYLEKHVPLDEPLRLHITGCPNACAQYQIAHIGLLGAKAKVDGQVVDAYDILIGGRLGKDAGFNHALVRKVPATECAKRLEHLLLGFKRRRKARESFNAWCARAGDAALVQLLTEGLPHPLAGVEEIAVQPTPEADGPAC